MGNWKKRLREIAKRSPKALPSWLQRGSAEEAWYRVSWQVDGGIDPKDAARPAIMILDYLVRKGLLSSQGISTYKSAITGVVDNLALTRGLVLPKAASFLDQHFENWWEECGINLAISADLSNVALDGLEKRWHLFGTVN